MKRATLVKRATVMKRVKPERKQRQQQVINTLRTLDLHAALDHDLVLMAIDLFPHRDDIVLSLVTACGTVNICLNQDTADKLARRLRQLVREWQQQD